MKTLGLWLIGMAILTSGCMTTIKESNFVTDGQHTVIAPPEPTRSAIDAELTFANGVVQGRLRWANACHNAIEERSHEDIIETSKPNYGGAVGGVLIGGLATVASVAILANSSSLSNEETCGTNLNGDYSCSSPKQDAMAIGIAGAAAGVLLGLGSMTTFGAKSKSTTVDSIPQPPKLVRVDPAAIPCGQGPIPEINVAMYLGQQRLSASSSNLDGQFALVVPENTTGNMVVVIESVPSGYGSIRPNVRLGAIEIPAERRAGEGLGAGSDGKVM